MHLYYKVIVLISFLAFSGLLVDAKGNKATRKIINEKENSKSKIENNYCNYTKRSTVRGHSTISELQNVSNKTPKAQQDEIEQKDNIPSDIGKIMSKPLSNKTLASDITSTGKIEIVANGTLLMNTQIDSEEKRSDTVGAMKTEQTDTKGINIFLNDTYPKIDGEPMQALIRLFRNIKIFKPTGEQNSTDNQTIVTNTTSKIKFQEILVAATTEKNVTTPESTERELSIANEAEEKPNDTLLQIFTNVIVINPTGETKSNDNKTLLNITKVKTEKRSGEMLKQMLNNDISTIEQKDENESEDNTISLNNTKPASKVKPNANIIQISRIFTSIQTGSNKFGTNETSISNKTPISEKILTEMFEEISNLLPIIIGNASGPFSHDSDISTTSTGAVNSTTTMPLVSSSVSTFINTSVHPSFIPVAVIGQ